jgi:fatty acid synthase subunit beta, fungi type
VLFLFQLLHVGVGLLASLAMAVENLWQANAALQASVTVENSGVQWHFRARVTIKDILTPFIDEFACQNTIDIDRETPSCVVAVLFLSLLRQRCVHGEARQTILAIFRRDFLPPDGIYALARQFSGRVRKLLLNSYLDCVAVMDPGSPIARCRVLEEARKTKVRLVAIFGGQGNNNTTCLVDLLEKWTIYGSLVQEFITHAAGLTKRLAEKEDAIQFHGFYGFDLLRWLDIPEAAPSPSHLALAPVSCPLITVLSICNYIIFMKEVGLRPQETRKCFTGVTGHSLGVLAAAVMSRTSEWGTFYEAALHAVELSFWIGLYSHEDTYFHGSTSNFISGSVEYQEGFPMPMLQVQGLTQAEIQTLLDRVNDHIASASAAHVAVVNTKTNIVVAGSLVALKAISLLLRQTQASPGLDQSRVLFTQRKPEVSYQFLPISAAFHTPYLRDTKAKVLSAISRLNFPGDPLGPPLYHTKTGNDVLQHDPRKTTETLIEMITVDRVIFPQSLKFAEKSFVIDFGPGFTHRLVHQNLEGTGTKIISASTMGSENEAIENKFSLYSHTYSGVDWVESYAPMIQCLGGKTSMVTKMTRLLDCPPVMVAGMTPTTSSCYLVSSIMNAGYHVELAAGGFYSQESLETAIKQLSCKIPEGRGICCNVIYANPKAIRWQIPLIKKLIADGYPIHGLTIGAGIPSLEVVEQYVTSLGLKYIGLKPGSMRGILEVTKIAQRHPNFTFILQWTGGRSGGHHSFEDFHSPLLATYSSIRQFSNVVLVVGSGFGDGSSTYQYLNGNWSQNFGHPKMPVDGILLGSRMMVAREARTSRAVKQLIVDTPGTEDQDWHKTFDKPLGGVTTIRSEMGQPLHVLATKGARLWKYLDEKIFSIIDIPSRLRAIKTQEDDIIRRLDQEFQRPWFAHDRQGLPCPLEDMTYLQVLERMAYLMYISNHKRWIHNSYAERFTQFAARTVERLQASSGTQFDLNSCIDGPDGVIKSLVELLPEAQDELLHHEDVAFFLQICSSTGRHGSKPINFVPRLDENFETWFKKDSLWQAENIEMVVGQDPQRVLVIHGPVAAKFSTSTDESASCILDCIVHEHLDLAASDPSIKSSSMKASIQFSSKTTMKTPALIGTRVKSTNRHIRYEMDSQGNLPSLPDLISHVHQSFPPGSAPASIFNEKIIRDGLERPNPLRQAFRPFHGQIISVWFLETGEFEKIEISFQRKESSQEILCMSLSRDETTANFSVIIFVEDPIRKTQLHLKHFFQHKPGPGSGWLVDVTKRRESSIQELYAHIWLGGWPLEVKHGDVRDTFFRREVQLDMSLMKAISVSTINLPARKSSLMPLDVAIIPAWKVLVIPLLVPGLNADILQLVHKSIHIRYLPGSGPLILGESVQSRSQISSLTIEKSGKAVVIDGLITRNGVPVIEIQSSFFFRGSYVDYENTFEVFQEPDIILEDVSPSTLALLDSRNWILLDGRDLLGKNLLFRLTSEKKFTMNGTEKSLTVTGSIFNSRHGQLNQIGRVILEITQPRRPGNAAIDFLLQYGRFVEERQYLPRPGWKHGSSTTLEVSVPCKNELYAILSKDTNPIHTNPVFASYAQLPGTITHGMMTSALVRSQLESTIVGSNPRRFRSWKASFLDFVMPGEQLRVVFEHVAMIAGRMVIQVEAYSKLTNIKVLSGEAEIEQAETAYIFTGQGSQRVGMGMDIYETSSIAREWFDKGDAFFVEKYGMCTSSLPLTYRHNNRF